MDERPFAIMRAALERLLTPAAARLAALLFAANLAVHVSATSVSAGLLELVGGEPLMGTLQVAVLTDVRIGSIALMGGFLAVTILSVVIIRTYLQDDLASIPSAAYTQELARPVYGLLAASMVTAVIIVGGVTVPLLPAMVLSQAGYTTGALFIGIPGAIAAMIVLGGCLVGFLFAPPLIIDQEMGPIQAVRQSWPLTREHRTVLLLTGLIVTALTLSLYLVSETVAGAVFWLWPAGGSLVRIVAVTLATLLHWATLIEAYRRLIRSED